MDDDIKMESIEVTARFDGHGIVTPLSFSKQGRSYTVESTGRRWEDDLGQHILVMVCGPCSGGDNVFELVFNSTERVWHLKQIGSGRIKV